MANMVDAAWTAVMAVVAHWLSIGGMIAAVLNRAVALAMRRAGRADRLQQAGTLMRSQTATPACRYIVDRRGARLLGLTVLCPLLVDGAGRNLRGNCFSLAAFEQTVFDVRVLAFALSAPRLLRHVGSWTDAEKFEMSGATARPRFARI